MRLLWDLNFFWFSISSFVCLWWKVEFGDGLVVFENGLVVGTGCVSVSIEGAETLAFAIDSESCLPSLFILGNTSKSSGVNF